MSESLVIRYLVIGVAVFTLTMPGCSARQANSQISRVQKHLGFPWDEAKVTIYQRASVRLPVADGFFQIQLGDITSGRVFVTVHGRDHELVTDTTLMRQGDTLSLSLGGRDYVLCLSKLVNLIIGHDFGVFSLMPSRVWQAKNSVPDRLDFPWEKARMTIHQRASKKLRGEDGFLRVQLGDITAGEVPVTIFGPNNEVVVDTTAMQQGDTLPVPLARRGYVLRLDRLVNLPIGDDFGVFSLMLPAALKADEIEGLLKIIAASDATFLRNVEELSGRDFAAHLRRKYECYGPKNASVDEFIEKVASRSSSTGTAYRIRLPDGQVTDVAEWLREQIATTGTAHKGD